MSGGTGWGWVGCQGRTLVSTRALTPLVITRRAALASRLRRVRWPECFDFAGGGVRPVPGKSPSVRMAAPPPASDYFFLPDVALNGSLHVCPGFVRGDLRRPHMRAAAHKCGQ